MIFPLRHLDRVRGIGPLGKKRNHVRQNVVSIPPVGQIIGGGEVLPVTFLVGRGQTIKLVLLKKQDNLKR